MHDQARMEVEGDLLSEDDSTAWHSTGQIHYVRVLAEDIPDMLCYYIWFNRVRRFAAFMTRPKIMIVEDEPAIADTIQYSLSTDGFETICFNSGGTVIAHLAREQVDLIILDIGLPDINGFELCKEIRKTYLIPIIFLTARVDEVDRVVGLEIGGDDYVIKPFSPRELSARVKAVLRRGQQRTAAARTGQAFQVDESRKQISFFGQRLDLSRYEYEILKTFIRRPGHVFSREQLMDMVWDEPEASMDRTVDAHIKNIRIKLKAIKHELEPIITHRGMGYSLREEL